MVKLLSLCLTSMIVISMASAAAIENIKDFTIYKRVRQPTEAEVQEHKILSRELASLRKRLNHIGAITDESTEMDKTTATKEVDHIAFDEMETLRMVPTLIAQLRHDNIRPEEHSLLSEIFGDLWDLIKDEANRSHDTNINPVLAALLSAKEMKISKSNRHFRRHTPVLTHMKDILRRRYISPNDRELPHRIILGARRHLSLPQRILRLAAFLIHASSPLRKKRSTTDSGAPDLDHLVTLMNQMNNNNDEVSEEEVYDDYAFEAAYDDESEDDYMRKYYSVPQMINEDYENGSVNELIELASKHNKRRSNEENKLKKNYDVLNSQIQGDEDYNYNDDNSDNENINSDYLGDLAQEELADYELFLE